MSNETKIAGRQQRPHETPVMQPENGKIYAVRHRRKGIFKIFVESQDDEWLTGLITEGEADAILDYNRREQFEEITIRKSFCSFKEVA